MARRKVSLVQLRDIVRARVTKGSAFMLTHEEYKHEQEQIKAYLATLDKPAIFAKYPNYTYDLA